jgi:hypothetical protein
MQIERQALTSCHALARQSLKQAGCAITEE